MNKYILTIKHSGFTPTKCHYYSAELNPLFEEDELTIVSKTFTKVFFQGNPIHDYIANCINTNMPIVIKAEIMVIETPFKYTPYIKKNGVEEPLIATYYDMETNTYKKKQVVMNTARFIFDEHELTIKESLINKYIKRLKKWKIQ